MLNVLFTQRISEKNWSERSYRCPRAKQRTLVREKGVEYDGMSKPQKRRKKIAKS